MAKIEALDIAGYNGRVVPNRFFKQDNVSIHGAISFPGSGYRGTMPLLYYAHDILASVGADVLLVDYAYNVNEAFNALDEEAQYRWFYADITVALQSLLQQHPYEQLTFVGKSLGTQAMGHLLATQPPDVPTQAVWLTPLLTNDTVYEQMQQFDGRSLIAIGTANRFYNAARLAALEQKPNYDVVVIEGAPHSMDIGGDVLASIRVLETVVAAMIKFCTV